MAIRLDYPKKCFYFDNPEIKLKCEGSNSAAIAFQQAMERILINDPEINLGIES